jgi:hypothetical protein
MRLQKFNLRRLRQFLIHLYSHTRPPCPECGTREHRSSSGSPTVRASSSYLCSDWRYRCDDTTAEIPRKLTWQRFIGTIVGAVIGATFQSDWLIYLSGWASGQESRSCRATFFNVENAAKLADLTGAIVLVDQGARLGSLGSIALPKQESTSYLRCL